jgi:two-component system cell cycle response regulator
VGRDDDTEEATMIGQNPFIADATQKRDRAYLTVIVGANVGEMYAVGGGLVIGRGAEVEIRVMDDEISRRHAQVSVTGNVISIEDLGSKNGTFVNGTKVRRETLRDGDKIQIGGNTVLRFSFSDTLEESFQRQMYESALRDPLTRIYNRKYLMDRMSSEMAYAVRHGSPLSLLLFDIDHFKKVNDTRGHLAGDAVLTGLARHTLRIIRTEDVFARYGGEEFAILSRGIALDGALKFGERLRGAIETYPFMFEGQRISVTISIGITALPSTSGIKEAAEMLALADKALYASKDGGRNRVSVG